MNSKQVYFVRHGESVTNATGIRQGPAALLTELGKKQARRVAERIAELPIEHIVVSPYERTRETSLPIIEATGCTNVEHSELFVERRNPSIMLGTHKDDPQTEQLWAQIAANYHVSGWRYTDEENFDDLIERAKNALGLLEKLPEQHVLVVSHGMFMRVILAHVLLGDHLDGRIFWDRFVPIKTVANTGIMHLEYTENFHKTGMYWKLISWNDHAHLHREPTLL